ERADAFLSAYQQPPSYEAQLQDQLVGVEIMRRLIGYAQLDLSLAIKDKKNLLELSRNLVLKS
ncbi:aminoglycoside phosphotransferase, partial [bacterium]|nr:aminoglycoside phosphotransferase [bacterium]